MVKDNEPDFAINNDFTQDKLKLPSFTFTLAQKTAAQNLVLAVKKLVSASGWREKEIINLPEYQEWVNAIKDYSVTKLCGSWVDTDVSDRSLKLDLLNLRDDQVYELSQFSADVINKIRKDLGVNNLAGCAVANPKMVSLAQEISRLGMENPDNRPGYDIYTLKKAAYDHGLTSEKVSEADRKIAATNPYGEMLMIVGNDQFTAWISIAEAKEQIVKAIANLMLINNGNASSLGCAEKLIGVLAIPNNTFNDNIECIGTTLSFKDLKYNSVIRPSYLVHIIQSESWQIIDRNEENSQSGHSQPTDPQLKDKEAKKQPEPQPNQLPIDDIPDKSILYSSQSSAIEEVVTTGGTMNGPRTKQTDNHDPFTEKDELQEHNRFNALKRLLKDVVVAIAYLLGLKKVN